MKTKTNSTNVLFKNLIKENKNRPLNKSFFQGLLFAKNNRYFSIITWPNHESLKRINISSGHFKTIGLIFILMLSTRLAAQVAPVNPPTGDFNIDGTLKAQTAIGDWVDGSGAGGYVLQNNGGIWEAIDAATTKFIRDDYNASTDFIFTGGSAFGDNPNGWKWTTGKPTSKCDINTVLLHSTTSATQKWLILGGDRLTTTGTSYIDFEFSQGVFTREGAGKFKSVGPANEDLASFNGRTPGDFVLSMEYSNGGTNATVHFYRWEQVGNSYKYVEKPIPGNGTLAFGATNGSATDVPYGAFGSTSYIAYAFVEAAVNIDGILSASCLSANIKTVFVKTKASDSYSAALKDFIDPIPVNFQFGSASLDYGGPNFCKSGSLSPTVPASPSGTFSATPAGLSINATSGAINLANSDAGTYTVTYTPASGVCLTPATDTVIINPFPTANAGSDFTKTCTTNPNGKQIGEANNALFSYSWSPSTGLSASNISNPVANPTSTTTYTVTKTNIAAGCSNTDSVDVTVNNTAVTANAGSDFSKTCTTNLNGKQIGEANDTAFTYSWAPSTGLSAANVSNPTANPSSTTTYTVTKTNTASGCSGTDSVDVTVNNASVTANAGSDFTKTCTDNTNGKQIGEANNAAFSYSWSPSSGLNNSNISNPTANPTSTTTYTVTKTNIVSGCSGTDSVDVTVSTAIPDTPTVCIVQPSLCGPATGSITINSPTGSQYQYSIDNGNTWQSSPNFNSLAAGSVTGIKVKNVNTGCISSAADCSVSDCTALRTMDTAETLNVEKVMEKPTSVKAFPNPFKNTINFVVEVPESGEGSLELMNFMGQKVRTVFNGKFTAGKNTYEVNLPSNQPGTLIYILNIGDKRLTGKLIQL